MDKRNLYIIVPLLLLCAAWVAPVHLKTTWGDRAAGDIDTNIARTLVASPLSVTDDKGGVYTITRFRFSYRQKSVFQDSTGKVDTSYRLFSKDFFNTTVLDTFWSATIAQQVQPGEVFFIDNVVARDAKGVKVLAPGLELDIR